ncbi:MAG TPA: AAA family ATPase [Kiritimatiellia bacterium]|nr:AAA family ATPase [Kiritimatiellia bacterium]
MRVNGQSFVAEDGTTGDLIDLATMTYNGGIRHEAVRDLASWLNIAPVRAGKTWDFDAPLPSMKATTPPPAAPPVRSDEVEAALLGAALADPADAERIRDLGVVPGWFYEPDHAVLFRAIVDSPNGIAQVIEALRKGGHGRLADSLHTLIDHAATATAIRWHVDKLREAYHRRQLIDLAMLLREKAHEGDLTTLLESVRDHLDRIDGAEGVSADFIAAAKLLTTEPPPADQIIRDLLDAGDKLASIAASKTRKTFLMLQLVIAVSTGGMFAGLEIPTPRRVLYVNLEIRGHHFHRRLKRLAARLKADAALLGKNLFVVNVRDRQPPSITLREIEKIAVKVGAELIVTDPIYKLHHGDENAAADMKPLLADFDALTRNTGAAVAYVHHDAKGTVGDRKAADRGAGSNVIGRDYDAALIQSPHRTDAEAVVVEFVARNYAPRDAVVLRWSDGAFEVAEELEATKESTAGGRTSAPSKAVEEYVDRAFRIVVRKPLPATIFHDKLKTELGLSEQRARALTHHLIESGTLAKSKRQGMGGPILVGAPGAIAEVSK